MDELSASLVDKLIEKTFENMTQEEKLAFVERLFLEMPPENQERFLQQLVQKISSKKEGPTASPTIIYMKVIGNEVQNIGPWQMCCRMMAKIDDAEQIDSLNTSEPARIFNALADETRIKIIKLLMDDEKRVDDLTQTLDAAQPTVSHHLRILKDAGLITGEKRGRSSFYSLTRPVKIEIR